MGGHWGLGVAAQGYFAANKGNGTAAGTNWTTWGGGFVFSATYKLLQQVVLPAVDDWQRRAGRGMTPGAQIQGGAPGARAQAVSTPRRTSAGSSMKCGTTWPA